MTRPDPTTLLLARAFPEAPELAATQRLDRFLQHYWRQRWLLLPGALADDPDLPDLLDGDELAGLACEEDADARIVFTKGQHFHQETGPFDPQRFAALGDADWTLLVNGVDLALPGFEPLLRLLRFVPDWRLDDVMVSFAAPGGSVGPHFDHYDVFLIQAQGRRRWELGDRCDGPRYDRTSDEGLDLVSNFDPAHVVHCEPGDVLYVPPGLVHHGIAETPCLTLSLGLRAPSTSDLLAAWTHACMEPSGELPLELDPPLPADPGTLAPETIELARRALRDALLRNLDDADPTRFTHWLGCALTQPGRGAGPELPAPMAAEALAARLAAGALLERSPGARPLRHDDGQIRSLFVGGQAFPTDGASDRALGQLVDGSVIGSGELDTAADYALAAELYNAGWLYLVDPGEEGA